MDLTGKIPNTVQTIVRRLWQAGHEAYPVGGAVRDLLLKRKIGDWDVATSAVPEKVSALFPKVLPTGIAHGTVTVMAGKKGIEVTTFRGDLGYTDGRHPDGVVFLKSLPEDLKRRDFTINAMAIDLANGRLIDPFGGQDDLSRQLIRAVGDPLKRFSEDGLRPMRAVRFAAVLGFEIEAQTFAAIPKSLAVFRKVAPERIREELLKILESRHAAPGIELLRGCGLLEEILPELTPTMGFVQNRFHRHDVYQHSLESLEWAKGDGVLKLAILLHDIGKPRTAAGGPTEHTFYQHERVSAEMAEQVMRRFRFSNAEIARARTLIDGHMFHYEAAWTDGAVRRLINRVGEDLLADLWEMRRADAHGRGMGYQDTVRNLSALRKRVGKVLKEKSAMKVTDLAIDGREVMTILGCGPSRRVGDALDRLLELVLDDPTLNQRETLISLLKEMKN
jgi:tRNA nucleotidyltransferase (CCA-adding enzyme)